MVGSTYLQTVHRLILETKGNASTYYKAQIMKELTLTTKNNISPWIKVVRHTYSHLVSNWNFVFRSEINLLPCFEVLSLLIFWTHFLILIVPFCLEHIQEQSGSWPLWTRRLSRLIISFIRGTFEETWCHISFTVPFGSSYSKYHFTWKKKLSGD